MNHLPDLIKDKIFDYLLFEIETIEELERCLKGPERDHLFYREIFSSEKVYYPFNQLNLSKIMSDKINSDHSLQNHDNATISDSFLHDQNKAIFCYRIKIDKDQDLPPEVIDLGELTVFTLMNMKNTKKRINLNLFVNHITQSQAGNLPKRLLSWIGLRRPAFPIIPLLDLYQEI